MTPAATFAQPRPSGPDGRPVDVDTPDPWALYDALIAGIPEGIVVTGAMVNSWAAIRTDTGSVGIAMRYVGGRGRPTRNGTSPAGSCATSPSSPSRGTWRWPASGWRPSTPGTRRPSA